MKTSEGAGILVWVPDNGIPESSLRYEGQDGKQVL
jgi:hypothetical protein